jgi:hypothetical protein
LSLVTIDATMKASPLQRVIIFIFAVLYVVPLVAAADDALWLAQLNGYWAEVSRSSVREGDFEGYRATTHAEGVLVTGIKS